MTITRHQHSRETHRVLLLTLLAIGALGPIACGGGDDDETTTEVGLSREQRIEQEIERTANDWATLFAGGERFCALMTRPACGLVTCETVRRPIENCTPPSSEFRKSFRDSTVWEVAITGDTAAARFSNGETVELERIELPDPLAEDGDRLGWLIHRFSGNAGAVQFITKVGNAWAPLFAEDNSAACEFMFGQPLCEEFFGRVGEPPEVGRPSAFQRSFADATVEGVWVEDAKRIRANGTPVELHTATAEFSNGEVVEFIQETDPRSLLGEWYVNDVGTSAPDSTTEAKLSREQVQELEREANTWASLFAVSSCNRYMGQPFCGRLVCRRDVVGPRIENCTPVSAAFQTSFADATVEDIESERIVTVGWTNRPLHEAAVRFSNGEVVVFMDVPPGGCPGGGPCKWGIADLDQNRRFVEAAAPRG